MSEGDSTIASLYQDYKATKPKPIDSNPTKKRGSRWMRQSAQARAAERNEVLRDQTHLLLTYELTEQIKTVPSVNPLNDLDFITRSVYGHGFSYSFKHTIEEDTFTVDFWSEQHKGIFVQRQEENLSPQIEVLNAKNNRHIPTILHLPEGFQIPVGPLTFGDEDSYVMDDYQWKQAIKKATEEYRLKGYGAKAANALAFGTTPRKHAPKRYFFWQPELPETPAKITIDFGIIKPIHMALVPENAPTFTNTAILPE